MKAKRNARVAAVQVIFQYYFSRSNINKIICDYRTLNEGFYEEKTNKFDSKLFEKIILVYVKMKKKLNW